MKAERVDTALQPRSWSLGRAGQDAARHVVLLLDGTGEADSGDQHIALSAPVVLWLGSQKGGRLRIDAGGSGFRASAANDAVAAAVGDQAESAGLAALVDRDFALSLAGHDERAAAIERCLAGAITEQKRSEAGSALFMSALLRVVLVTLLRVAGGVEAGSGAAAGKPALLQRFRSLVEMNFRSHWPVSRYCEALGISPDRLHAVCTTGIGKTPKALIAERLAHEAATRLERSALTVSQLGHVLGFNDPAHFSNFFRRMRGVAPGRYRKLAAEAAAEGNRPIPSSFSDWP